MSVRVLDVATALAVVALVSVAADGAKASTVGFFNISNNSGLADDVEDQLSVNVGVIGDEATFTFKNNVGIASSITDIYFDDDDSLLDSLVAINGSGGDVSFTEGAAPGNLPGGKPFSFMADFSLDSDSRGGLPQNGVDDALESVSVVFQLVQILTLDELLDAILAGGLRIGLHVQAMPGGGSDGFISGAGIVPNPIPIPAGLVLFLSGLVGLGVLGRINAKRDRSAV